MTANVRALIDHATQRLRAAGIDSPRVDAELLLCDVLGVDRGRLVTRLNDRLADNALRAYEAMVDRRAAREPVQYILGTAPFRHVTLAVGPGVFVPRPETELLVDAVLPHLRALREPVVVDLCAGSGALALAVADEVPSATVYAVEHSAQALVWLRRNAEGTSVNVVNGDVRDERLLGELGGRVDAVVSNPPYVPEAVDVSPEVRADPAEAVFGGDDGLDVVPSVIARAAQLLKRGGVLAIEHDDSHGDTVPRQLLDNGHWQDVDDHHDLSGRPRFATATLRFG